MSKTSLTQFDPDFNDLINCPGCGRPTPPAKFLDRDGDEHDLCNKCRRAQKPDARSLYGYSPLPAREWVLPPGCEVLAGADWLEGCPRRVRGWRC